MKNPLSPVSVTLFISRESYSWLALVLQIIVPHSSAVLESAGETSCGIHAGHISICKYPSSDSPAREYKVAATNISRFIRIINLVFFPDFPASFDALALLLFGDELGVKQARSAVLKRARDVVGSIVGRDNEHVEELAKGKVGILWYVQLVKGIESLNLPADIRTSFRGKSLVVFFISAR